MRIILFKEAIGFVLIFSDQ